MLTPVQVMTHLHPRNGNGSSFEPVEEHEVVVVGAGPAGLSTALTLGQHGVDTLVIDRRPGASPMAKATVASTGTVELLRRWGLEDAVREASIEVEWRALACETLAAAGEGQAIDVGLPTRDQAAVISPAEPLCIGQDELEPLMEGHLAGSPTVRVEREVELVSLEREPAGYLLALAGPDGRRRTVRARFVVGADGIRSTVRDALGIAADGEDGFPGGDAVMFRAPLWDVVGPHRHGIYFMESGDTFIPLGKPDRWLFAAGGTEVKQPDPGEAAEWVREAAGVADLPVEVERVFTVTFGVSLADRFRDGDAFLIGDAAHRVTPRGGTGMNTAIRDGFDIAWKLAWVLRGWAGDELLDTYERERRPVVEYNTARSTREDGSILGNTVGINLDIGGRIPHVWVPRGETLVSTLDLLGDGLTVLAGPDWEGDETETADGPPIRVERLDAISARGLGVSASGAMVVRPDGMPVTLDNEAEVNRALSTLGA